MANGFNLSENLNAQLSLSVNKQSLSRAVTEVKNAFAGQTVRIKTEIDTRDLGRQLSQAQRQSSALSNTFSKTANNAGNLGSAIQNVGRANKTASRSFFDLSNTVNRVAANLSGADSNAIVWISTIGTLVKTLHGLKNALNFEREMVHLAQVTDRSLSSVQEMGKEIQSISVRRGANAQGVLGFATTLSAAGLPINEIKKFNEVSAALSLSSEAKSVEDFAKSIVILRESFGTKDVGRLTGQLGTLISVSKSYASTLEDQQAALSKAGSVFATAGDRGFQELVAASTTIKQATQLSGDTIGIGLKSLRQRLSAPKHVGKLSEMGVNLEENGRLVDFTTALERLRDVTASLPEDSIKRAAIMQEASGLHHAAQLEALIQNLDSYRKIMAEVSATDGADVIFKQADTAAQSLGNQFDRLTQAVNKFWSSAAQSETLNNALKTTTSLLTGLIDRAGSLTPILALLGGKFAMGRLAGRMPAMGLPPMFAGGGLTHLLQKPERQLPAKPLSFGDYQKSRLAEMAKETAILRENTARQRMMNSMLANHSPLAVKTGIAFKSLQAGLYGLEIQGKKSALVMNRAAYSLGKGIRTIGTPLLSTGGLSMIGMTAGFALSQREDTASQTVGTGMIGASVAAQMGVTNPFALGLVAATSALVAFKSAVEKATEEKKTERVKGKAKSLEIALAENSSQGMFRALNELASESRSQTSLAKSVGKLRTAGEMAYNLATLDWGKLSPSKAKQEVISNRSEALKVRMSEETGDLLSQALERYTQQFSSYGQFEKSGVGKNILDIVKASGQDVDVFRARVKTSIELQTQERKRIQTAERLAKSEQLAEASLLKLSGAIAVATSDIGRVGTMFENLTPQSLKSFSNAEDWIKPLQLKLGSQSFNQDIGRFPAISDATRSTLTEVNSARQLLPQFLNEFRSSFKEGDFGRVFEKAITDRSYGMNVSDGIKSVLTNSVQSLGWEEFSKGLGDVGSLSDKLLSSYEPLINATKQTAESFNQLRASALENAKALFNARKEAIDAQTNVAFGQLEYEKFRNSMLGTNTAISTSGNAIVQAQSKSLAGSSDVNVLGQTLRQLEQNLRATGDPSYALGINRVTSALSALSNSAERTKSTLDEIARIQGNVSSKEQYAIQYYTGDANERRRLDQMKATAERTIASGKTAGQTSDDERRQTIQFLSMIRDQQNVFNSGKSGADLLSRYIADVAGTVGEINMLDQLKAAAIEIQKDSLSAQRELANHLSRNAIQMSEQWQVANKENSDRMMKWSDQFSTDSDKLKKFGEEFKTSVDNLIAGGGNGPVFKAGGGTIFKKRGTDTVPAMLTPGEFVVNRKAAQANLGLLSAINAGNVGYFASGGQVGGGDTPNVSRALLTAAQAATTFASALQTAAQSMGGIPQQAMRPIPAVGEPMPMGQPAPAPAPVQPMAPQPAAVAAKPVIDPRSVNARGKPLDILTKGMMRKIENIKNQPGYRPMFEPSGYQERKAVRDERKDIRREKSKRDYTPSRPTREDEALRRLRSRARTALGMSRGGPVRYYAGGGSVSGSNTMAPIELSTEALASLRSFDDTSKTLGVSLDNFAKAGNELATRLATAAENLAKSAALIPAEITLSGTQQVTVTVQGLSMITALEPMIKQVCIDSLNDALKKQNSDSTKPPSMRGGYQNGGKP